MKTKTSFVLLIILVIFFADSIAQENNYDYNYDDLYQIENNTHINVYGSAIIETSQMYGKLSCSMGSSLGILCYDHFKIGGYYFSTISSHYRLDIPNWENQKLKGGFSYGGVHIAYIFKPSKLINYHISMKYGWGRIMFFNPDVMWDNEFLGTKDHIVAVTPTVDITYTPLSWLRLGLGAGYLSTYNYNLYDHKDYDSPVLNFSITFGKFYNEDITPVINTEMSN